MSAQIRVMSRRQRHQAAYFALRRLQAPLLGIEMPTDWGIDPTVLTSLLHAGAAPLDGEANEDLERAVAELCSAPLFESGIEPEFAESFQLEAISGWLMLSEALGEMSEEQTDRVVRLARELAVYLDSYMAESLTEVGGGDLRESYLADIDDGLRSYGLGYFGTRNIEVEAACHEAVLAAPADGDLADSAVGRRLKAACDEYSGQLLSALRAFVAH